MTFSVLIPGIRNSKESFSHLKLAYRMQTAVPNIVDLSKENAKTKERYGITGNGKGSSFGAQCLTARRLSEAGVRFIQVSKGGWDQHKNLKGALTGNCRAIDRPIAALLQDLKDRDMLKDTLVVWGGEFGRTPQQQAANGDGAETQQPGLFDVDGGRRSERRNAIRLHRRAWWKRRRG